MFGAGFQFYTVMCTEQIGEERAFFVLESFADGEIYRLPADAVGGRRPSVGEVVRSQGDHVYKVSDSETASLRDVMQWTWKTSTSSMKLGSYEVVGVRHDRVLFRAWTDGVKFLVDSAALLGWLGQVLKPGDVLVLEKGVAHVLEAGKLGTFAEKRRMLPLEWPFHELMPG